MTDENREARLRAAASAVAVARAHSVEVLDAINATFDELPGRLSVPDDLHAHGALAREIAAIRAELLAANGAIAARDGRAQKLLTDLAASGALAALEACSEEQLAELWLHATDSALGLYAVESAACRNEKTRQLNRLAVLKLVLRELDVAAAG